ncbi:MAG: pyridoxal-phosphate dependent enzyme [Firmicutes bacterium]|nr:pyridoxal-phosphate dependent enzyme [Candidatus Fermentithermobacillaceae bacterium]
MLTYELVEEAKQIAPLIRKTPLLRSDCLSELAGGEIYLKLENLQRLNAFKIRGMLNKVMSMDRDVLSRGIAVVSSGNFGLAASYCGSVFDIPVDVFVPRNTPQSKLRRISGFGAKVKVTGDNYDQCRLNARQELSAGAYQKTFIEQGDIRVMAGYGTIATELVQQEPDLDEVLVPVGGGSLMTGIAVAMKALDPSVAVSGVQTAACPAMAASLEEGRAYEEYPCDESVCEGLIGGVERVAFEHISRLGCRVSTVSEASILKAVGFLLFAEKLVVEPSAAAGVACVLESPRSFSGRRVAIVISGGNIDSSLLAETAQGGDGESFSVDVN